MNKKMDKNKINAFDTSNIVWAKMRYFPYWPARIVEAPASLTSIPRRKIYVFFFGSRNYGFVDVQNVEGYLPSYQKYSTKGKGQFFRQAVEKCDEFLKDPVKYYLNCDDQPNHSIVIKTEPTFNVKVEDDEDQLEIRRQVAVGIDKKKADILDKLKMENTKLVQDNLCLKENYDRVCGLLNEKEAECSDLQTKLTAAEQIVKDQNAQIRKLERKQKKPKCLKKTYNVEEILDHKMENGKMIFLIRWEDFTAADDTWEPEENLLCKNILQEYLSTNHL